MERFYDEENKAIVISDCDADMIKISLGETLLGEVKISDGKFILSNVDGVQSGDTIRIEKHKIETVEVVS